jgi:mono/diheme cytochrome c family protein
MTPHDVDMENDAVKIEVTWLHHIDTEKSRGSIPLIDKLGESMTTLRDIPFMKVAFSFLLLSVITAQPSSASIDVPDDVMNIYSRNCMSCHSGKNPQQGLNLSSSKEIFATGVSATSKENDTLMIIDPGNPEKSYLIMKIRNDRSISGSSMPKNAAQLSQKQVQVVEQWIASLSADSTQTQSEEGAVRAFDGWTVGNIPTAEIPYQKQFLFFIGHRFIPKVSEGYDSFYGLNGPAVILLSLGYSITDNLFVSAGRSNADDLVEIRSRFRLFQETGHSIPLSLAIQNDLYWNTLKLPGKDRWRSDAFTYTLQIITTKQITEKFSFAFVPGLIINPDTQIENEDPVVVFGIGGRYYLGKGLSFIMSYSPEVSGKRTQSLYGFYSIRKHYDTLSVGIEKRIGGHDFQIFVTNSEGIATPHYATGGDLNFGDGNMRLGFSIYRLIGN